MGELAESKGGLLALLHSGGSGLSVAKPFDRDIFLYKTTIAGTTHIEGIDELEPHLQEGDRLPCYREPDNPYDKHAILIRNGDGVKLGYVPRKDNLILSRLMDGGKEIVAVIEKKEIIGDEDWHWVKITIKLYLHE